MLELKLREELRGQRLKGTTVDFTNQSKTGALEVSAADFLKITYPSFDLLKTIEATSPGKSRPVVLLGSRGQGKSHLMAALYHLCTDHHAGTTWLAEWADRMENPQIAGLKLRSDCCVLAESLHLQRYKYPWDILFKQHPKGERLLGKWGGMGDKKTDVPGYDLMVEMFSEQPTILILDEFQTWYEGLTNTKQYPWRNWAFNFIQILSEIAQKNPELLVLVVSARDGNSDAYQQVHRVHPVDGPGGFEQYVLQFAQNTESIGKLLKDLREPRPGGKPRIPWLGEVEVKERVVRMCAEGQIVINLRGLELLQARPGESAADAWQRMKGKIGAGKHLDETRLYMPDAAPTSGGKSVRAGAEKVEESLRLPHAAPRRAVFVGGVRSAVRNIVRQSFVTG